MALKRAVRWGRFLWSFFSLSIEEIKSSLKYVAIIPGVSFQVNVFYQVVHLYGPFLPNSLIHSVTIFVLQPFPKKEKSQLQTFFISQRLSPEQSAHFFWPLGHWPKNISINQEQQSIPSYQYFFPEICMPKKLKILERAFPCFFFIDRISQLFYYRFHYPKELFAIGDQLKLLFCRQTITNMS